MPLKNTYKKTVTITSTKDNPVPLNILADHIKDISNAMKNIKQGPVRDRVIVLLIKDLLPRVTITDIEQVLNAAGELSSKFLR